METLTQLFRQVFDDPELELYPEMTSRDVYGWDSLSNMSLLVAIERRFAVKIPPEEQALFRNVGEMARYIAERQISVGQ